jgi:MFS family permease
MIEEQAMSQASQNTASGPLPGDEGHAQAITRGQWLVLGAAFLGWMFTGVEIGLFPLVVRPAFQSLGLIDDAQVAVWNSVVVAAFLLGAAAGGIAFGWLGDKIGRVRSMVIAILMYSLFTGVCAFAQHPWELGAYRFLASLGMGGEWALAVALVMECWPEKHRPKLAGAIGAAANFGFFFIALVALLKPVTQDSWRWMMFVGASPALLAVAIALLVPESERWKASVRAAKSKATESVTLFRWTDLSAGAAFFGAFAVGFFLLFAFLTWFAGANYPAGGDGGWRSGVGRMTLLLALGSMAWAGGLVARRPAWFLAVVALSIVHAVAAWSYRDNHVFLLLTAAFVIGMMGAAGSVREIFSAKLRKRTLFAIVFSSVPLIGTWAAVSGWIPTWVDQMTQIEAGRQALTARQLAAFDRAQDPKAKIALLKRSLPEDQLKQIATTTARSKAWVQLVLSVGAIIGCFVAPVIGGIAGRRPVYFALCLASLILCAYLFRYLDTFNWWFNVVVCLVGGVTAAFYGWLPLYLPELFPTRVRATGQGLSFNFGRILAAVGTFYMGYLVALFGGDYGKAMAAITLIYVVGMIMIWFAPETKGKPLPE